MDILRISSTQNPRIKRLMALQLKPQLRRDEQLIVVEGARELSHCMNAGFKVQTVIYCPTLYNICDLPIDDTEVLEVTPQVYDKIAYRGSTEGVMAIVEPNQLTLADLQLGDNPLIVVLEGVEKMLHMPRQSSSATL